MMDDFAGDMDLYEILEISRDANKTEIKKAYHKAALSSHPDKVSQGDRAAAEIKFKAVSKAYEILYDDNNRHLYDTHGMSAFEAGHGNGTGSGPDLEDMLQQMFGMGGGGAPPGFMNMGGSGGPQKPRKGENEELPYQVTLEELYKGKTAKFSSKKNVICSHCKGSGGKDKAKSKHCASCQGRGMKQGLRSIGPGLVTQETVMCSSCKGTGSVFKEKDRCKKCKGERVTEARKVLELYIPRGSREGDRIILAGEADQVPDQEPGDLVFNVIETEHPTFRRAGADLSTDVSVTLAEALCGFSRVVVKHLDGRGISITHPQPIARTLKPGSVIKVAGEGMPIKKSEMKGDLYLVVQIEFPEHSWLEDHKAISKLQELLPKPAKPIQAETVDDVVYDETATLDEFGGGEHDGGEAWEDDDEEGDANPQCAQQ